MTDASSVPPFLARVRKGSLCAGCGGCAAISTGLEMRQSSLGYMRPEVIGPVSDEENIKLTNVCPGLGQLIDAGDRLDDVVFGPDVEIRDGWAMDPELRFTASSGGALSAVLVHLLETNAVDGVLQVAADPEDPDLSLAFCETAALFGIAAGLEREAGPATSTEQRRARHVDELVAAGQGGVGGWIHPHLPLAAQTDDQDVVLGLRDAAQRPEGADLRARELRWTRSDVDVLVVGTDEAGEHLAHARVGAGMYQKIAR